MTIMREIRKFIARWGFSMTAAVAVALLAAGAIRLGAQTSASGNGGPREGITVHGHWAIDVRQPNGTLVTHREFENALTSRGGNDIALVLSRQGLVSNWSIILTSDTVFDGFNFNSTPASNLNQPCLLSSPVSCVIVEQGFGNSYGTSETFDNLLLRGDLAGLHLSGTATAARTGQIIMVAGQLAACGYSSGTAACVDPAGRQFAPHIFSVATLEPPIPVVLNQLIQASVTYTFSAAATTVVR
jgi:hypothetical protein